MVKSPQEELKDFLSDIYAMELQALAQLETAPEMAGAPVLAEDFRTHLTETREQAAAVRRRLEAVEGSPSAIKDSIMKLGGKAFLLFARLQTETPGRLAVHAYSYEAMEVAGYAALIRFAEMAGDSATADMAATIMAQERLMMNRLEAGFDDAEAAAHKDVTFSKTGGHVRDHLADAHALESQSMKLLEKWGELTDDPKLTAVYTEQLGATRRQLERLERRLEDLGADRSTFKDLALKTGALNWRLFFRAQADTPVKVLVFTYAVKHLEIGGYELLARTARRADDGVTLELCRNILEEERLLAEQLAGCSEAAVRETLDQ